MARIARIGGGFALMAAGVLMLILPGPGIVTIVAGLALLSRDFEWARRVGERAQRRFASLLRKENPPVRSAGGSSLRQTAARRADRRPFPSPSPSARRCR